MRRITRGVGRAFDLFDLVEMVLYGVGGAVLLGVGTYFGVRAATERGGSFLAGGVIALLVVASGMVIRDARRRSWSSVSIALGAVWVLSVLVLVVLEAMA